MSEIERAFDPETHSAILRAAELAYETSPDDGTALERAVIAAVHTAEQHRGKQEPVGYEVNFRTFGEEWVGWHRPGPEFTREHYQKKAKTQPDRYLYRDLYASPQPADVGTETWAIIERLRAEEGHSVEILCDNPDGLCAVVVCGDWTGWEEKRIEGNTVIDALRNADAHRIRIRRSAHSNRGLE